MVSILLYGYLMTIFPNPTNIFCTHRTHGIHYEHYFTFTIALTNLCMSESLFIYLKSLILYQTFVW